MQLGIYTFADVDPNAADKGREGKRRMDELLAEIELADQVGLDVFGLGEHHRPDYMASSPATILAAAAARTKNIRLTSAVTVLSSEDPVRVFQQYATIDLISGGRAEIMAGRGSFIESFPLFGYDLDDYDKLFDEKLQLLMALSDNEVVSWSGETRAAIPGLPVYPRPLQDPLPLWIAVGGTPNSVARAAYFGLPLALAIIGGEPRRFAPLFDLYRKTAEKVGHDVAKLPTSINVHGFVAETTEKAAEIYFEPQAAVMNRIGRERGFAPMTRAAYDAQRGEHGAIFVGSPQEMADKIVAHHRIFRNDRFLIQMGVGLVPHAELMKAIELLGTKVAPLVKKALTLDDAKATSGAV
ncbi:LLM class flavin-dependent oxidoreductase [Rhizobium halophytocola]|uniref:LLM family oxidoreductase n=1 Tax=Rhizobium halophytocola TaxID=735519 RepID=A0ABS4E624_9HYPH|nr:LLM class flavin-dependent oxidoreductase [Rhizobium halophytocola]MBP1853390.1 putative LLM family oxidoreductase [Rhizobium halophytocola]